MVNRKAPAATSANRVALYARYSSDRQSEHSIEDQLRICRSHAERQGWTVVGAFHDAAISGTTTLRPGYQALQAVMRAGEVDIVLAEALDRFSRDQEHIAAFHKLVGFTQVRLVTISDGEVNALHVGLKGTMNALFLQDLAAKTRRGLEGRVRAGRAVSLAPYGYRRVTSVLRRDGEIERGLREIVPEQAAIVQRIFCEYAAGTVPAVIARRLNAEGIASPNGPGWNAMSIRGRPSHGDGILRNRCYIGEIVWNRRHRVVDPSSGQAIRRLNPTDDRVTGLTPELRIIDDTLWERVQQRLAALAAPQDSETGKPRFWERRQARHLLSGKVICGACGGPFSGFRAGYYSCNNVPRGLCTNRTTPSRAKLEAKVLTILAERMMDPELCQAFVEEFVAGWNQLVGQQQAKTQTLRRELDAAERKLANLLDAIADGLRSPGLQAKLSAAEAEQQRLAHAVAAAKPSPIRLMPNLGEAYRRELARLRQTLAAGDDPSALATARALIDRVVIYPARRGSPPDVTVEGHLAGMLAAAQPGLPDTTTKAMASLAALSVKEGTRGQSPLILPSSPPPAAAAPAPPPC